MDFPEAQFECATILRTPTPYQDPGCGRTAFTARHATCVLQPIAETFAVQFCCGTGDCKAAGVPDSAIASMGITQSSESVKKRMLQDGSRILTTDAFLKHRNGTIIKPASIHNVDAIVSSNTVKARAPVQKRRILRKRAGCNDFRITSDPAGFTRPSDMTQIVSPSVNGGNAGM